MSQINSLRAYDDCRKVFESALLDPRGARARIGDQGMAMNMRTRMHYFRNLDREANKLTYPEDHSMHGTSVYDPYVVRLIPDEDDAWWVYVQPRGATDMIIEGLSEVDELIDVDGAEVQLIEGPNT